MWLCMIVVTIIQNKAVITNATAEYYGVNIRTLQDFPSQINENLIISNSKLTSDSELIW